MKRIGLTMMRCLFIGILLLVPFGCQKDTVTPIVQHTPTPSQVAQGEQSVETQTPTQPMRNEDQNQNQVQANQTSPQTSTEEKSGNKSTSTQSTDVNEKSTSEKGTTPSATKETHSKTQKSTTNYVTQTPISSYVTISIVGDHNQIIVPSTKVAYEKGDSFLKATLKVVKANNLQITVKYSGNYVSSIDNLQEMEKGHPLSGWIAKLNGEKLKQGVGVTPVHAGDVLEWMYSITGE